MLDENKIIELRKSGKSYSDIAKELGSAKSTIAAHCIKLGVNDMPKQIKDFNWLISKSKRNENGCIEWLGGKRNKSGYGATHVDDKTVHVHRLSWILNFGEIPDGLFVCHKCDNPPCINPEHLFLGTHRDNMLDCQNKGRMVTPTHTQKTYDNYPVNAVMPLEEALKIKEIVINRGKRSLQSIADEFGLKLSYIKDISSGRTLKNK